MDKNTVKRKIEFLVILFLLFLTVQVFAAECGDVDADGDVDIIDALLIAQYYVDLNPDNFDSSLADVDGDDDIDIVDALLVAQYYVDLIDELTGCTAAPTPTPVPVEPETVFAVNCGGSTYTASDGTEYASDTGYSGGTGYDNGASVSGTSDPTLYSTERYGSCTYSASVPNGDYRVTLHFAENYHTSSGSRSLNVLMEDTQVISNLDIYAEAGASTAYVTEDQVAVSDGEINIEFVTVTENALINAIKVDVIAFTGEPIVRFTVSPSASKPGETVTVDASDSYDPDGSISSYQVDWGDGSTTNGAVTSHQYTNEDTYAITVTVTDNEGKTSSASKTIHVSESSVGSECPFNEDANPSGTNWVNGNLITFNNSGGWCWYQDERAIVDTESNTLIIGSVQNSQVHAVHYNLSSGSSQRYTLDSNLPYTDDHDTAAFVKTKDGGIAAMWAGHKNDNLSRFSYFNGSSWSSKQNYDWGSNAGDGITYANMWYIGNTLYSYVRSTGTSPNYLYSNDNGRSWNFGGRLTSTPTVGYVAGYYKYWGNNEDRIDFLGTEAHPRDFNNSLYHGYIQNGRIYNSNGQVIDSDFTDRNAQNVTAYTKVFSAGSSVGGVSLDHAWNADLVRYDDGTVAAIWTGRVVGSGSSDPDKRLMYARFDGSSWHLTYLARAGTKLYDSEQDYTGLGALDPDNPEVIYISTPYDPRTDSGDFNGKKEIWKGVTCDNGSSFNWVPITANSSMDNLRPIVPKWDGSHRAVLWMRGTYSTAQNYNTAIVGLIEGL